jgi:hypothetical protein
MYRLRLSRSAQNRLAQVWMQADSPSSPGHDCCLS